MEEGARQTADRGDMLLAALRQGQPIWFDPPTQTPESDEARARRTIPADLLLQLIDRTHGRLELPVEIAHAVIDGPLDLTHVSVERPFEIIDSEFTETVDCTFAAFTHGLRLDGSRFHQAVSFRGVDTTGDFLIRNTVFDQELVLADLHVSLVLDASGTTSFAGDIWAQRLDIVKVVDFTGAAFGGDAHFTNGCSGGVALFAGAHFAQLADFSFSQIGGPGDFIGAQFQGEAHFHRTTFSGGCLSRSATQAQPVRFAQLADFGFIQIGGQAQFTGAQFDGEAHFGRATVGGDCHFRSAAQGQPVRFAQLADFRGTQISELATFIGAQFGGDAWFRQATIGGACLFHADDQGQPVRFDHSADFSLAQISGLADFRDAEFRGEVKFEGARFAADARFSRAVFRGSVSFHVIDAVHDIDFEDASFLNSTTFRGATFGTLSFAKVVLPVPRRRGVPVAQPPTRTENHGDGTAEQLGPDVPQLGTVDLTGMTYTRMQGGWRALFKRFDPEAYDRQPYTQLEATLRQAGEDRAADDVYYARRKREFLNLLDRHSWWDVLRIPGDALYWLLAGYGVRPLRFVLWSLLALAVGTWVFLQPNAVTYADATKQAALAGQSLQLDPLHAFEVSLDQLLPIAIPGGSRFMPSDQVWIAFGWGEAHFADYASLQTIIGWVLITALFNIVAGAMRRQV